jgi:hypothetical protein
MRKVALLISAGALIFAGAAFAQNAGAPKAPAATAPAAAAAATQSLGAPAAAAQVQTSAPADGQQASDAACNADAQKFCSGKEASERLNCLNENKPKLAAACQSSLGAPRN